jgi:hypothetical protein
LLLLQNELKECGFHNFTDFTFAAFTCVLVMTFLLLGFSDEDEFRVVCDSKFSLIMILVRVLAQGRCKCAMGMLRPQTDGARIPMPEASLQT